MDFEPQILFFFSGLGAFNALILGLYFIFFKKEKGLPKIFLGALLLALSIRTGKSVFLFFNPYLFDFYIQLGLSACLLIGPFLYLYSSAVLKNFIITTKVLLYHIGTPILLATVLGISLPYHENFQWWSKFLVNAIYLQWFIYIIISGKNVYPFLLRFLKKNSNLTFEEMLLVTVFTGVSFIWLAYSTVSFTSYISGALTFSFMLYILIFYWGFQKKKKNSRKDKTGKYTDKKIPDTAEKMLLQDLELLMRDQKLYKNPNLKLADLAAELKVLPHYLSQFLNDNLGKSFSLFINEYRISEAKIMIRTEKNFTLEAIGYESGFNSKSTFFSTFKKITGLTPANYRERLNVLPHL